MNIVQDIDIFQRHKWTCVDCEVSDVPLIKESYTGIGTIRFPICRNCGSVWVVKRKEG